MVMSSALCDNLGIIQTLYILKMIFKVACIVIPIILMINIMITIFKSILSDNESLGDVAIVLLKKCVVAVCIFFIPTLMLAIIGLAGDYSTLSTCYKKSEASTIKLLKEKQAAERKIWQEQEKKRLEEREKRLAYEEEKRRQEIKDAWEKREEDKENEDKIDVGDPGSDYNVPTLKSSKIYVNGVMQPNGVPKNSDICYSDGKICSCPNLSSKIRGFTFRFNNRTDRNFTITTSGWSSNNLTTASVTCSDGTVYKKSVNKAVKTNFENAFRNVCKLITSGINGVKLNKSNVILDGTFVSRTTSSRSICSPHAYGIAIDINYSLSISVNGKSYKPYSGQGSSTKKNYDAFVSAIGSESNIKNVNYVLWVYAFKPAGFIWGGNWSAGSYDPMHFESHG